MSLFITFEGPDGSGKSTQIGLLSDYLTDQGHDVHCTREPGGTAIGDQIRTLLHDVNHSEMHPVAELLLYSASRAQLVAQVIKPVLAAGGLVLCDRYAQSTYAYQGYGHGLDLDRLTQITEFATQQLEPDLVIYLDLPVAAGLARKQRASAAGQGEWNRMDRLAVSFHERVRQGYLAMARADPARWLVLDAQQPIAALHRAICAAVDDLMTQSRYPDSQH